MTRDGHDPRGPRTPRVGRIAQQASVAVLVIAALAGCAGSGEETASSKPSQPPAGATSTSRTTTSTPSTTSTSAPSEHEHEGVDPSAAPDPTPLNTTEARLWADGSKVAVGFLRAWAPRPGDTKDAWLARVMPYLTEEGRGTYTGVWPIQGVWTTVTGPAKVRPWADPTANSLDLPVAVPTDVGVITVHIDPEKMLVATFDLPGQE